jgi:hypothetical protein
MFHCPERNRENGNGMTGCPGQQRNIRTYRPLFFKMKQADIELKFLNKWNINQ